MMTMQMMNEPCASASFPADPVTEMDREALTAAAQWTAGAGPSLQRERPP
jgi:hypothetical protein